MQARQSFKQRKQEVEKYLQYLQEMQKAIIRDRRLRRTEFFFRVAKANVFLMLYNLVEATTRDCLDDVTDAVKNEAITFAQATNKLKKEWITDFHKDRKFVDRAPDKQRELLLELVQELMSTGMLSDFDAKRLMSGNIDHKQIHELSDRFGVPLDHRGDGSVLGTVRHQRNCLAHGLEEFSILGGRYTISELEEVSDKSFRFLFRYVAAVERYINSTGYKV
jgi:hypothetical protein